MKSSILCEQYFTLVCWRPKRPTPSATSTATNQQHMKESETIFITGTPKIIRRNVLSAETISVCCNPPFLFTVTIQIQIQYRYFHFCQFFFECSTKLMFYCFFRVSLALPVQRIYFNGKILNYICYIWVSIIFFFYKTKINLNIFRSH